MLLLLLCRFLEPKQENTEIYDAGANFAISWSQEQKMFKSEELISSTLGAEAEK